MKPAHGFHTVKVFISSTFRDMRAERDHLTRFVFPRLRQALLSRRIHVEEVDLRWGVTSDQNVIRACREIIDECHRFLCILGGCYGTVRPNREQSITEEEIRYAVLERGGNHGAAFFYYRSEDATARAHRAVGSTVFADAPNTRAETALRGLKSSIEKRFQPRAYHATWNSDLRRFTGLRAFGDQVYSDLLQSIDLEFGVKPASASSRHEEDRAATGTFIAEQERGFFLGTRTTQLETIQVALVADPAPIVCLVGAAGSGKSALMAAVFRALDKQRVKRGERPRALIPIFVGCGVDSSDDYAITRVVAQELRTLAGHDTPIPDEPESLRQAVDALLREVGRTYRVVVMIDGIDNVERRIGAPLDWYPILSPPGVRLVVSCRSDAMVEELQAQRRLVHVVRLVALTRADLRTIVESVLKRYGKQLEATQLETLLKTAAAGSPLYARAVLEELRSLGTRAEVDGYLAELDGSTPRLFRRILERLAEDPVLLGADDEQVGALLVPRVMSLLASSRAGLSAAEIVELSDPGDPLGNVAAILALLRPYLMRRDELIDFYHDEFRQAAIGRTTNDTAVHTTLARYFEEKANGGPLDRGKTTRWRGEDARPFRELTWHLAGANREALRCTLRDFRFLRAKIEHGLIFDLIADHRRASELFDGSPHRSDVDLMKRFFMLSARAVAADPNHFASQICGRLEGQTSSLPRELLSTCRESTHGGWLEPGSASLIRPTDDDAFGLAGHEQFVSDVRVDADGVTAVSASSDRRLIVWDLSLGRLVRQLRGHQAGITALDMTPDGVLALSGAKDLQLRLWSVRGGHCLYVLEGHHATPTAVALSASGDVGVSVSDREEMMRMWDLRTGRQVWSHPVPKPVDVVLMADGRGAIVLSDDGKLRAFDLEHRRALGGLPVHLEDSGVGRSLAMARDGELFAWSGGHGVGLWAGDEARTIEGGRACYVAFGPNDELCWATDDGELRIVSSRTGADLERHRIPYGRLAALWKVGSGWRMIVKDDRYLHVATAGRSSTQRRSHTDRITSVAISGDGRIAVSADAKGFVHVWDAASGIRTRDLSDEGPEIAGVALSRDGRVAAAVDEHGGLRVWQLDGLREPWRQDAGRESLIADGIPNMFGTIVIRTGELTTVVLCATGRLVLVGSADRQISVWDSVDRVHRCDLEGHRYRLTSLAIDGAGRRALSASDTTALLWDLEAGTSLVLTRDRGVISSVALSEAGDVGVSAADRVATLWATTPQPRAYASLMHETRIRAVAASADGRTILSATADWNVRVWDTGDGTHEPRCVAAFTGDSEIRACGMSSDGRTAVAGEESGRVHFLRVHRPSR